MILPIIGPDEDIPAPDVNTNEEIMGWIMDTYSMMRGHAVPGIVTGKPLLLGGSLGRTEATGRGVSYILRETRKRLKILEEDCTAAILGFGKVGKEAARRLFEDGVRVVAVSDTSGGVRSARGLNIQAVVAHVESGHKIAEYQENGVEHITNEELIATECTHPGALRRF